MNGESVHQFLLRVNAVPWWDREPGITDSELDRLILESADGNIVHGEWLPVDEKEDAFDCSECDAMVHRRHNFCPKCGAKMDAKG